MWYYEAKREPSRKEGEDNCAEHGSEERNMSIVLAAWRSVVTRAVLLSGGDRGQAGVGSSVSQKRGIRKCRWAGFQQV